MPSHLHWIIKLDERRRDISRVVGDFKSYIAHEILDGLKTEKKGVHLSLHPLFSDNPNVNIESPSSLLMYFKQLAHNDSDQDHRFWQRNSDIKLIETYSFLKQKLNYIHYNPVRGKWNITKDPLEYPFSSCRYYQDGVDWYQLKIMSLF